MSTESNANSNTPNRGANRRHNGENKNKKKTEFTGSVKGFGKDVLVMPSERPRGVGPNHSRFKTSLLDYAGAYISEGLGRVWAVAYIRANDSDWEPPFPEEPETPKDTDDKVQTRNYKKALAFYEAGVKEYKETIFTDWPAAKLKVWSTIRLQCSHKLKEEIQQSVGYDEAHDKTDAIWLLRQAFLLSGGGKVLGLPAWARSEAIIDLYTYKQAQHQSLEDFTNEFRSRMQIVKTLKASLHEMKEVWTRPDGSTTTTHHGIRICIYLRNVNEQRYGACVRRLRNDSATGTNRFPPSLEEAYQMLHEYEPEPSNTPRNNSNNNANSENVEAYLDIDPSRPENEICLTSTKYDEMTMMIDAWWILLDTASTVTIFNNPKFLRGIRKTTNPVVIHTSGGQLTATLEGYLPFLQRWVAFHPDCLGNILLFCDVFRAHHVTMNLRQSHTFVIHFLRNRKGRTIKKVHFRPSGTGLFYFDTQPDLKETFKRFSTNILEKLNNSSETVQNSHSSHKKFATINMSVAENLKPFTPRHPSGIEKAREAYAAVGRPGFDTFLRMIKYRQMPNMPIREHDAKNMIKAYGPDVHALKGKTVRQKPEQVPTARRFSVPPEILNANSDVVLCTDIFFVDCFNVTPAAEIYTSLDSLSLLDALPC